MTQTERQDCLIHALVDEQARLQHSIPIPPNHEAKRRLLRSLLNIRPPMPTSSEFLALQDEYLQMEIRRNGITDLADLSPIQGNMYLWRGDITTLKVGAIVNAANDRMLGCFVPCHSCIDNAIHTYAGVQLRLACDTLMQTQGRPEKTGTAKITPAFNLPCDHILHTVGPIISGSLTSGDCLQLASCYRSCLELAAEHNIDSIAFCCISTGEFHFPNQEAAEIAIDTVTHFLAERQNTIKVVFNVFKENDEAIYRKRLGAG